MTDLEAIKKAHHERVWLEPAEDADPYTGQMWCEDNQWGDKGVEYVLASTLEILQRENEELREKTALHSADAKTAWAECDELRNLAERLKLEAQSQSMEARTANSTINEIYQIISDGKGEPGNWSGAEPVRAYVEVAKGEILRLETELALSKPVYSRRKIEDRVKALEAALKPFAEEYPDHMDVSEDNEVVTPHLDLVYGDFRRARQALASTGGEHHGN